MNIFGGGNMWKIPAGGGGNMWKIPARPVVRVVQTSNRYPFSSTNSSKSTTSYSSRATSPQRRNKHGYASLSSDDSSANDDLCAHPNSGFQINNWSAAFAASACGDEDYEMVSADESELEKYGAFEDHVFGHVPSVAEVQQVVSAIGKVFDSSATSPIRDKFSVNTSKEIAYHVSSPAASESGWIEPMDTSAVISNISGSGGVLQNYGPNRVYDAFHLLRTDPTVQQMVCSLSSDKDVWKSVLRNRVVKELRESYYTGDDRTVSSGSSTENSHESSEVTNIVKWIFDNTMDLYEKMTSFLGGLFKLSDESAESAREDIFEHKLRTSFMLCVFVVLVVVVARAKTA